MFNFILLKQILQKTLVVMCMMMLCIKRLTRTATMTVKTHSKRLRCIELYNCLYQSCFCDDLIPIGIPWVCLCVIIGAFIGGVLRFKKEREIEKKTLWKCVRTEIGYHEGAVVLLHSSIVLWELIPKNTKQNPNL